MTDLVPLVVIAALVGALCFTWYWVGWVECWLSERRKEQEKSRGKS